MTHPVKFMLFSIVVIAASANSDDMQQHNIFEQAHELDKTNPENKNTCTIIVFKIKESNNIYYYLIPRLNTMNRSFSDAEDFFGFARFKTLDDMISYIKKNNLYGYHIDNGLFYTGPESFRKNALLPKESIEFNSEECKKIINVIPNKTSHHWKWEKCE